MVIRLTLPSENPFDFGSGLSRGAICECTHSRRSFKIRLSDRFWLRFAHCLVAIAFLIVFAVTCAPDAFAQGDGIPGVDLCDPEAPLPQPPDSDLPGIFIERPKTVITAPKADAADTSNLFSTSGVSGMRPIVYDLGCGFDPSAADDRVGAWTNSNVAGMFITWSQTLTMFTSAIEQYAWDPAWIPNLLGNLAEATVNKAQARVVLPFLGTGLIMCSVLLVLRARKGNFAGVAQAVAWAILVLLIGGLIVAKPTSLASGTQAGTGAVVSSLYGGSGSPTLSATESIMRDVHYQGWLRRTFGNENSETARRYGPTLLAATRTTWTEFEATDPSRARSDDEREQILERRKEMLERKADLFKETAEKIKNEDPEAYTWLTGRQASFSVAIYEWLFAIAASLFRIMAGLVVILGLLLLTVLGFAWLLASPWLVTPWGEGMGRGLLDATARSLGYVIVTSVGTWMYVTYSGIVMTPGTPTPLVLLLLALGTFAFWAIVRPDRKILSLLSAGRVRGRGKWSRRMIKYSVLAAVASKIVTQDAGKAVVADVKGQPVKTTSSGSKSRPRPPAPPPPPKPKSGRKPPASIVNPPTAGAPGGTGTVYTRPTTRKPRANHPTPPPPGATGTVTSIYTRPGARTKGKRP